MSVIIAWFLVVNCVILPALNDAATGKISENDLVFMQRQLNELKVKQELYETRTNEEIVRLENLVDFQSKAAREQNERIIELESKLLTTSNKRLVMDSPLVESGRVAFSASLDHDLDAVVNNQKIVFNVPHYNDGTFYNVSSGIFTAPTPGVYLFIYFIGNRHAREVDAELVVNGVKQNEAVAEGVGTYHDTQGGNSAIVKLNAGDMVWIDTTLGDHVEGHWMFSSFTGALLYPIY